MQHFKDKVVVITGAGSGMGKDLAILMAKDGARLALNDWSEGADPFIHFSGLARPARCTLLVSVEVHLLSNSIVVCACVADQYTFFFLASASPRGVAVPAILYSLYFVL